MIGFPQNLSRRDFALVLLGALTLGVGLPQMTGCSLEGAQQQIEDHLKQKYGDIQYTIFNFAPYNAFDHTYNELSAYLPGGDSTYDGFDAKLFTDGGANAFQDSYYGIIIRTQFEAMAQQVADKYFKHSKVFTTYDDFPDDVTATTPLEQVLSEGKMAHNFVDVYVDSSDYMAKGKINKKAVKRDTEKFAEEWKDNCSRSAITGWAITKVSYDELKDRHAVAKIRDAFDKYILDTEEISSPDWSENPVPGVR
jgi:hypothetical protein